MLNLQSPQPKFKGYTQYHLQIHTLTWYSAYQTSSLGSLLVYVYNTGHWTWYLTKRTRIALLVSGMGCSCFSDWQNNFDEKKIHITNMPILQVKTSYQIFLILHIPFEHIFDLSQMTRCILKALNVFGRDL